MSSYNLSMIQGLRAIACRPDPRRERLAAVVKENFVEIPVVIIPNHAPATNEDRINPLSAPAALSSGNTDILTLAIR
jgi:hypothetical protein